MLLCFVWVQYIFLVSRVPQGSCNIDINFPELFLDGAHVASGMQINNVMGVTIGPGGYFLNFTEYGVQINAGHEGSCHCHRRCLVNMRIRARVPMPCVTNHVARAPLPTAAHHGVVCVR